MTKEERIKLGRHRVEQESLERNFSNKTVMSMKRGYEIKCEKYESEIEELKKENIELNIRLQEVTFDKLQLFNLSLRAKDIIQCLCNMVRELNNPNIQLTNVDYSLSDAEQFLKKFE